MLQKITIQNFRSLKDVSLELQDVNVLIGANNSGKTNLLKAFTYFDKLLGQIESDFIETMTEPKLNGNALQEKRDKEKNELDRANFKNLLLKKAVDNISHDDYLIFRFDLNLGNNLFKVYQLEIKSYTSGLIFNDFIGETENNKVPYFNIDDEYFVKDNFKNISNEITVNHLFKGEPLIEYLSNLQIYQPNPEKLKIPYPLSSDKQLLPDTSNIVAFLDNMRDEFPSVFKNIIQDLNNCIEDFTDLIFQKVEVKIKITKDFAPDVDFIEIQKKIGLLDKYGNSYWAEELSEGTLYFLALLAIIHQPNPPKLLLLEEPERGIHPRRIKEVMDFIFRLASEKKIQIILTTHSPIVLDCFREYPEKVFVFDKDEEGATIVKNLEKDILIPKEEKELANGIEPIDYTRSMGSYWEAGFFGGVPKNINSFQQ
jgi:predicted ATPase